LFKTNQKIIPYFDILLFLIYCLKVKVIRLHYFWSMLFL